MHVYFLFFGLTLQIIQYWLDQKVWKFFSLSIRLLSSICSICSILKLSVSVCIAIFSFSLPQLFLSRILWSSSSLSLLLCLIGSDKYMNLVFLAYIQKLAIRNKHTWDKPDFLEKQHNLRQCICNLLFLFDYHRFSWFVFSDISLENSLETIVLAINLWCL